MHRSIMSSFSLVALFLGLFGCETEAPPVHPASEEGREGVTGAGGRLVIIGGRLQSENTLVYQAVLDGRLGEGSLCVLPTASGTPTSSMDAYVAAL